MPLENRCKALLLEGFLPLMEPPDTHRENSSFKNARDWEECKASMWDAMAWDR
jgi:hypothetical protein